MQAKKTLDRLKRGNQWQRNYNARSEYSDEYLLAMKRVHHHTLNKNTVSDEILSPRERHRNQTPRRPELELHGLAGSWNQVQQTRISTVASMVPDEIIYKHFDRSIRCYEAALMFIDVSGFTDLCESYTKPGRGGPSRLTQVLNSYIGAMVQEILMHNGDVLKFSGDAFLSMWKKIPRLTMQDVVHTAIDCGLIIQKNYGCYTTDIGVTLKVKVAIAAGMCYFSIIGGSEATEQSNYVIVGQPVWDVKMAEYMSTAGDVLTSASAWIYVNEAEYCTQPCGDGRHTKVLGVGATWKRVENTLITLGASRGTVESISIFTGSEFGEQSESGINYRQFSLRPAVVSAIRSSWWPPLRRFMVTPVLRAVDNDEPMDFLTEVRRVVVVFMNIITKTVTEECLISIVDKSFRCACRITVAAGGLVNKVSMFDKDMMFLVVFGLRGLKQEDEAQKALQCAHELKVNLTDENIISVSIGVTSGTTYCGVVGHDLRREYTVIGPAVNKAARLMMAYPMRVTCDKETFLRSKLGQDRFRMMEAKPLKGIAKPGPIYEFNKNGYSERAGENRHPILGRNEELRRFKSLLQNAVVEHRQRFTRFKRHKFAFAIIGPRSVGKTRLLVECLLIAPNTIHTETFHLTEEDKAPFTIFHKLIVKSIIITHGRSVRELRENIIRYSIDLTSLSPLQIYAINTIFDCRFPLPEHYETTEDFLANYSVKNIIQEIFENNFECFLLVAIKEAQYMDDASWRMLIILLEGKKMFALMAINDEKSLSPIARQCLDNFMIVKQNLSGIDRWYHAALACQLLDVQAIPPDLEKVIESASGGMPGWIQDFVISLVQRGVLTVATVPRSEAVESGAVMPAPTLLLRREYEMDQGSSETLRRPSFQSIFTASVMSLNIAGKHESQFVVRDSDAVQMAVLSEGYNFDDMTADMTMDAVVKLFTIRVLECEGGDFTRDTSLVLVHPAPALPGAKPPYCACLGVRLPPSCRDLPSYAFCGYMKFRHSLFRTTTYELLTESQKHELHARALLYLERYTRRCVSCGMTSFAKLLGQRYDDGLIPESEEIKRTKKQIRALIAETQLKGIPAEEDISEPELVPHISVIAVDASSHDMLEFGGLKREMSHSLLVSQKDKHCRSFSSMDIGTCECQAILCTVYCQIIDHCRGAGEYQKLYEAYMEYTDISIISLNIPQAIRLLFEVETFVKSDKLSQKKSKSTWMKDFCLAAIYTLRGVCMMESGDLSEAKKQLLYAMQLYCDPFPVTKHSVKWRNMRATMTQIMALYLVPNLYIGVESGIVGHYYEDIAKTLNALYRLFTETKEIENATLAAKLSLNYAFRTNANFRVLSVCFGNMIAIYRQSQKFNMCLELEKRAMDMCHRKRGHLDVTEVQSVCYLYTNIFLFYVEHGKKVESLEFGLSVMHMMSSLTDLATRQILILWMLKMLLTDLRIHDMVNIMREFFYMTDHYDLSSETWYYYYAIVIMMDTGYCVESYSTCEKFYIKKGDAILRSKTPEAAWNFFVCMWLITIRIGAWERSILWEEKIKYLMLQKFEKHEFNIMILVRLVEGLLITLVKEMDNRNVKKIILLEKALKAIFRDIEETSKQTPMYRPSYYLMYAYYHFVRSRRNRAFNYLNKAIEKSKQMSHGTLLVWTEHTRNHWKGTLNPILEDYWVDHMDPDNLLDHKDFDLQKIKIVPFTLPLPIDFER